MGFFFLFKQKVTKIIIMWIFGRRIFQTEGMASAKTQQVHNRHVRGTARRPVWLELSKQEEVDDGRMGK